MVGGWEWALTEEGEGLRRSRWLRLRRWLFAGEDAFDLVHPTATEVTRGRDRTVLMR